MKSWVLAVGLLAAAASGQAMAADLDEGPPDRYGSAYDDPRYADMYRYPDSKRYPEADPYERGPVPRAPVYRDRDDDDDYAGPQRHAYRGECVPREHIKHRLQDRGWQDFRDAELRGDVAVLIARRPSGRQFELTLDRCTGQLVNVRRLDGPYAYGGPGPRRWERY